MQKIVSVLMEVDSWRTLADWLDILHNTIDENCERSMASEYAQCCRRELVRTYCYKQRSGGLRKVASDIANVLEYNMSMANQAGRIRTLFSSESVYNHSYIVVCVQVCIANSTSLNSRSHARNPTKFGVANKTLYSY